MYSKEINSSQQGIHPNLEKVLLRHSQNVWLQPIKDHTKMAFAGLLEECRLQLESGFILDAGCGTGASSLLLTKQHPGKLIIGIDKSGQRLGRGEFSDTEKAELAGALVKRGNCVFLRAEIADFLRLLKQRQLLPEKIYFYYPNPWPKPAHLMRRWHGHPVFPELLSLRAAIELRSNWKIYLDEFALASQIVGSCLPVLEQLGEAELSAGFVSPFEQKYFRSGHALWKLTLPGDIF